MKSTKDKYFKPGTYKIINILVVVSFIISIKLTTNFYNSRLRRDLQTQARIAASSLDKNLLKELTGNPGDVRKESYLTLKKQLLNLKHSIDDCKYIYILSKISDGNLIFLINGSPLDQMFSNYNLPGQKYENANMEYHYSIESGSNHVIGPYKDSYGVFVCAMVPINIQNGKNILFAIDVDGSDWSFQIMRSSIPLILLLLIITIVILGFLYVIQRTFILVKKTSFELLKSNTIFHDTFVSIDDGLIITNIEGNIVEINEAGENIIERKTDEIKGFSLNTVFILQYQDSGKNFENLFGTIINHKKKTMKIDNVILFCKNKYLHVSVTASKIYYENMVQGVVVVFRDVSEEVYFQRILKEQQYKLRQITEKSPVFIITTDTTGNISFIEGKLLKKLNIEKNYVIGTDVNELFSEDVLFYNEFIKATLGRESTFVLQFKKLYVNTNLIPSFSNEKEVEEIMIIGLDVSENYRYHQSLKESEETFRALTENSHDTIMRFNKYGEHIYVNKQVEVITGIPRYKFYGKKHCEIGFPEYLCQIWDETINKVFQTGNINRIEFPLPNGIWLDWLLMPEFDEQRNVKAVITSARDISEKKKNETQLSFLQQYLSNIINSMPSMIIGINEDMKINLWNLEITNLTGNSVDDTINKSADEFIHIFNLNIEDIKNCITKNKKMEILKKDILVNDKSYFFNIIVYPLCTKETKGAIIRIDNITEHILLEKQLVQSEKISSLGALALGMAHEINNPIAGVIHNIEVIKNRLLRPLPKNLNVAKKLNLDFNLMGEYFNERKIDQILKLVHDSGRRAAEITINILNFSKKGNTIKSYYYFSQMINESIEQVRMDKKYCEIYPLEKLMIQQDKIGFNDRVYCNKSQITQVLINIIKNGLEAILETDREGKLQIKLTGIKNNIEVDIIDNGTGIKEEMKKYIFDPFFTTKSPNRGVGLGLAVSYFIVVHNHGGELYLDEKYKKGTKFVLRLPVA